MSSNWVSKTHNYFDYLLIGCFVFARKGTELTEAKEKLSRVESSSDDSDEEGTNKRKKIEVGEKPTEEMVEKMEEKLDAANVDQKRLFLIVFQRFIMILSEHLVRCDRDDQSYDTDWYRWTIGRLQQVFLLVSILKFLIINYLTTIHV